MRASAELHNRTTSIQHHLQLTTSMQDHPQSSPRNHQLVALEDDEISAKILTIDGATPPARPTIETNVSCDASTADFMESLLRAGAGKAALRTEPSAWLKHQAHHMAEACHSHPAHNMTGSNLSISSRLLRLPYGVMCRAVAPFPYPKMRIATRTPQRLAIPLHPVGPVVCGIAPTQRDLKC